MLEWWLQSATHKIAGFFMHQAFSIARRRSEQVRSFSAPIKKISMAVPAGQIAGKKIPGSNGATTPNRANQKRAGEL